MMKQKLRFPDLEYVNKIVYFNTMKFHRLCLQACNISTLRKSTVNPAHLGLSGRMDNSRQQKIPLIRHRSLWYFPITLLHMKSLKKLHREFTAYLITYYIYILIKMIMKNDVWYLPPPATMKSWPVQCTVLSPAYVTPEEGWCTLLYQYACGVAHLCTLYYALITIIAVLYYMFAIKTNCIWCTGQFQLTLYNQTCNCTV